MLDRVATILLHAWGWDIKKCEYVKNPETKHGQCWQVIQDFPLSLSLLKNWTVRLYKCGRSLCLFGRTELYDSCRVYGRLLAVTAFISFLTILSTT